MLYSMIQFKLPVDKIMSNDNTRNRLLIGWSENHLIVVSFRQNNVNYLT